MNINAARVCHVPHKKTQTCFGHFVACYAGGQRAQVEFYKTVTHAARPDIAYEHSGGRAVILSGSGKIDIRIVYRVQRLRLREGGQ
ncbi:MAG TPA: hypothetical protein VNL14_17390 [Candidatus Acidoferrales bacterium]|nr:hypothetical protein [Candidatus Acidoferrales bacterium]